MGAAALRGDGSATSDYSLSPGAGRPTAPAMALSRLLAKTVPAQPLALSATALDVVYIVEQRAFCVGLPEGALSTPLRGPQPLARLAMDKPPGRRQWLLPPVARHLNRGGGAAAPRRGAALRVASGVLALLQATQPAARDRIQLCLQDTDFLVRPPHRS